MSTKVFQNYYSKKPLRYAKSLFDTSIGLSILSIIFWILQFADEYLLVK